MDINIILVGITKGVDFIFPSYCIFPPVLLNICAPPIPSSIPIGNDISAINNSSYNISLNTLKLVAPTALNIP